MQRYFQISVHALIVTAFLALALTGRLDVPSIVLFTIGVVWNSLNLFVTHLMQAGAVAFWFFVHTGQVRRPETMMVTLGGIGHFVLIIACLAALFDKTPEDRKWWKFVGGGAWTLVYFFLIIAVARPR